MNRIHMELVQTIYDYGEYYWMIDGRPIVRYLNEAVSAGACPRLEVFGSLEGLLPAWTGELVWKAENRFIWEMVDSAEDLNVPVLVCEDDCDLSCIVIMAKIRKEPGTVYWDSLGVLNLENQDFRMEKQSGILCLEAYSDQVIGREAFVGFMMENPADYYYGVLWNKLYRRSLVEAHGIRMDAKLSWCEDFLFNLEYVRYATTFYALRTPVYYYVKTKGSLVNQKISFARTVEMKLYS